MKLRARSYLIHAFVMFSLGAGACGSDGAGPDSPPTPTDCVPRCTSKAQMCGAPADRAAEECASLCPGVTSSAQLQCLESSSCAALAAAFDDSGMVCGIGGPPPDGGVAGAFGDRCTCPGPGTNGAQFECRGTDICSSGLSCIGQTFGGVREGTCRGPECCNGTAECAAVLGTRGSCDVGQKCACTFGDLECVGNDCTCEGGVPATRGLCYPE